jgi:hypothetical protein
MALATFYFQSIRLTGFDLEPLELTLCSLIEHILAAVVFRIDRLTYLNYFGYFGV